jgi:hypothetical protein
LTGPLAALNADLPGLVYTPASNFTGSDTLQLTVLDASDRTKGAARNIAISVKAIPVSSDGASFADSTMVPDKNSVSAELGRMSTSALGASESKPVVRKRET